MVRFLLLLLFSPLLAAPNQDLYLEAYLDTEEAWYPGQENRIVYRIWYKGEIALIKEELPLLDIPGLQKVGDAVFYESTEAPFSIQEITQKYRATTPGNFTVPSSSLEGIHYVMELGTKKLVPPKLISRTPPYTLTISPFPEQGKPADFNGSIGTGTLNFKPPKDSKTRVGDPILFSIEAKDFGPTSVLNPPNLNCQPGFAGFFKYDPTTTVTKFDPSTKTTTYSYKILPENRLPNEIPPITWSIFNPTTKEYQTFKTPATPITITDVPPSSPVAPLAIRPQHKEEPLQSIPPFNLKGSFSIREYWIYLQLPLLLGVLALLFLRKPLKRYFLLYHLNPWRRAEKEMTQESDPKDVARSMHALLANTLRQKGFLKGGKLTTAAEPAKRVFEFMNLLDAFRFSSGITLTKEAIIHTGKTLYRALPLLLLIPLPLFGTNWVETEKKSNTTLTELLNAPTSKENLLATSFLLEQFNHLPEALYYLQKAEVEYPLDSSIRVQVVALENKMGVVDVPPFIFSTYPFVLRTLSFVAVLLGFYFFFKHKKKVAYPLFASAYILVALYFIIPLFTPKSAVMLRSSFLYKDAAFKEKASHIPLIPGDSVEVVGMDRDRFMIYSYPLETYGYILQNDVRPLD